MRIVTEENVFIGMRVTPSDTFDWRDYGIPQAVKGEYGLVTQIYAHGWCNVCWFKGRTYGYCIGAGNKYDLLGESVFEQKVREIAEQHERTRTT